MRAECLSLSAQSTPDGAGKSQHLQWFSGLCRSCAAPSCGVNESAGARPLRMGQRPDAQWREICVGRM